MIDPSHWTMTELTCTSCLHEQKCKCAISHTVLYITILVVGGGIMAPKQKSRYWWTYTLDLCLGMTLSFCLSTCFGCSVPVEVFGHKVVGETLFSNVNVKRTSFEGSPPHPVATAWRQSRDTVASKPWTSPQPGNKPSPPSPRAPLPEVLMERLKVPERAIVRRLTWRHLFLFTLTLVSWTSAVDRISLAAATVEKSSPCQLIKYIGRYTSWRPVIALSSADFSQFGLEVGKVCND